MNANNGPYRYLVIQVAEHEVPPGKLKSDRKYVRSRSVSLYATDYPEAVDCIQSLIDRPEEREHDSKRYVKGPVDADQIVSMVPIAPVEMRFVEIYARLCAKSIENPRGLIGPDITRRELKKAAKRGELFERVTGAGSNKAAWYSRPAE